MKLYNWKKLLPAGLSLIFSVHHEIWKIVAQLDAEPRRDCLPNFWLIKVGAKKTPFQRTVVMN
jgi:hypothetical protein